MTFQSMVLRVVLVGACLGAALGVAAPAQGAGRTIQNSAATNVRDVQAGIRTVQRLAQVGAKVITSLNARTQAQLQAAQTTTQTAGGRGAATGRGGAPASLPVSPSTATNRGSATGTGASAATPYVAQGGPFGTNVPGGVVGVPA